MYGATRISGESKPLVSIVTPAYYPGKFLENTIQSVMSQEYPNIEHIVLDDGSRDNTVGVPKRYEEKCNLRWLSKRNEGQATVNRGIDMAPGELVMLLYADDVLI